MTSRIAVINYGASNLASICNALKRLDANFFLAETHHDLAAADKVILPGVGNAQFAVQELKANQLFERLKKCNVPFLGICLGMHLLSEFSQEGDVDCFGVMKGQVKNIPPFVKIPHIGWNKVFFERQSSLLDGINDASFFYFVNSFYFDATMAACIVARTHYGIAFPSVVQHKNFYGVQFHPERSGDAGLQVLRNFIEN